MKVQSFRGAHGPPARLAPASLLKDSPTCRQVFQGTMDGGRAKPFNFRIPPSFSVTWPGGPVIPLGPGPAAPRPRPWPWALIPLGPGPWALGRPLRGRGAAASRPRSGCSAAADQLKVATLATFDCPKRTTLPGRTDEETDEIQMSRLRRVSLNEAQARKPSKFDNNFFEAKT